MLPIFPTNPQVRKDEGYSLLEILIVLAIMSLTMSVAGVPLVRGVENVRFSQQSKKIIKDIQNYRYEALLGKKNIELYFDQGRQLEPSYEYKPVMHVEEGWEIFANPIVITKEGYCQGGSIRLKNEVGREVLYELVAPKCKVKTDE